MTTLKVQVHVGGGINKNNALKQCLIDNGFNSSLGFIRFNLTEEKAEEARAKAQAIVDKLADPRFEASVEVTQDCVIIEKKIDRKLIALCGVTAGEIVDRGEYNDMFHFCCSKEGHDLWERYKSDTNYLANEISGHNQRMSAIQAHEYPYDDMTEQELYREYMNEENARSEAETHYHDLIAWYKFSYAKQKEGPVDHVIAIEDQTDLNLALVALCGVEPGRPIEDGTYQAMVEWVRSPEGQGCWQDYRTAMDGFDADLIKAVEDSHDAADLIERRGTIYDKRNECIAYYRNSYEAAHA